MASAIAELLKRREAALARAYAALDADWPGRRSAAFVAASEQAVNELNVLEQALRAHPQQALERARTLRLLGSLHADLGLARGEPALRNAEGCYREAEHCLDQPRASADPTAASERAKLDFNLANALRQLHRDDSERLQEARQRVQRARGYFETHHAQYLGPCDELLRSIADLERLAPLARAVQQRAQQAAEISSGLQQHSAGADLAALAENAEALQREGSAADLLAQLQAVADTLRPQQKADPRFAAVQAQLAALASQTHGRPAAKEAEVLAALQQRREREKAAGRVEPARQAALDEAVRQLSQTLRGGHDQSVGALISSASRTRDFLAQWIENAHYLSHGLPRPPAGSRAAALVEMNWQLRRHLLQAMNRPEKGDTESREGLDLTKRASAVDRLVYEAGADDARAAAVEAESLRPLAIAVRQFSACAHAMPAQPLWGGAAVAVNSRSLFHSGAAGSEAVLALACRRSGLSLPPSAAGEAHARTRWRQLQQAMVAVFDVRGGSEAERAGVCYELGIALTLGRPLVVLASPGQELPFDIDVDPVQVAGDGQAEQTMVADVLDRAVCWAWPEVSGQPWQLALDHVLASAASADPSNTYVQQTDRLLRDPATRRDRLASVRALAKRLDFVNDGRTRLVFPHWLPAYPAAQGEPRLFHVVPFRPAWAAAVSDAAREACRARAAHYVRGDEVPQPDVIGSIWAEIARASHVLVDLTGLNANVALELGMAHTLGKLVLMVGQDDTADRLFASVRKLRLQPYRASRLQQTLGRAVEAFLAARD